MTLLISGVTLNVAERPNRAKPRKVHLSRRDCLTSNGDVHFRAVLGDTLIQYCSATPDNLENKLGVMAQALCVRKGDTRDAWCSSLYQLPSCDIDSRRTVAHASPIRSRHCLRH